MASFDYSPAAFDQLHRRKKKVEEDEVVAKSGNLYGSGGDGPAFRWLAACAGKGRGWASAPTDRA